MYIEPMKQKNINDPILPHKEHERKSSLSSPLSWKMEESWEVVNAPVEDQLAAAKLQLQTDSSQRRNSANKKQKVCLSFAFFL